MNEPRGFWKNQFVPLGVLLGVALIIAVAVGAWAAIAIKNASNTLSVTGSAQVAATADVAKWTITATRGTTDGSTGVVSAQVGGDVKKIQDYLTNNGIAADAITLGVLHVDQDYSYNKTAGTPTNYIVRQDINVASSSPATIAKLAQDISALSGQGVAFTTQDPQYYVSNLADIRISLMKAAVDDAKARATQIVKSTGQSVGRLQSASSGVVQVMAPNSSDVSDYGTYDTSTIDKRVMVTVRATFFVN